MRTQMRYPSLSYKLLTTPPAVSRKKIRCYAPKHNVYNKTHIYFRDQKVRLNMSSSVDNVCNHPRYIATYMGNNATQNEKLPCKLVLIYCLDPHITDTKTIDALLIILYCFFLYLLRPNENVILKRIYMSYLYNTYCCPFLLRLLRASCANNAIANNRGDAAIGKSRKTTPLLRQCQTEVIIQ